LLTFPIDVVVLLLSSDHASTGSNDYVDWLVLSLIAHGSIVPVIAVALIFTSRVNNWKTDLCALIVLGAVRGIAINIGLGILDLEPRVSAIYKVFNSTISLPLWFIGLALFVESRRQFQHEFETIFQRYVRNEQKSLDKQGPNLAKKNDGELFKKLQLELSDLARDIEESLKLPTLVSNYAEQAKKIQDLISKELRPASAALWNGSTLSAPKLSIFELVKISLLGQKLKVISASLFFSPYIFIGLYGSYGWRFSFIETLMATSLNILIFMSCEQLFKINLISRRSTNILIIGCSYAIPLFVILFILPDNLFWIENNAAKISYQLFLGSCHVSILLGFNLYKLLGQQRSEVLANLEFILHGKEMSFLSNSELTAARDIDLARYLHGELQAGLVATSLLLERAVKTGDLDLANIAIRSTLDILKQDHARFSQSRKSTPQARLEKISSGWRGIAEVKIRIDWISELDTSVQDDVIELIDEGVSNAIRHAKSNDISVSGSRVGAELHIQILSDGSGFSANSAGLGTRLFNELTSNWAYSKQGDLNLLVFTIRST
jgi:signal transduction histidine kinase